MIHVEKSALTIRQTIIENTVKERTKKATRQASIILPAFITNSRRHRMSRWHLLITGLFLSLPAMAQPEVQPATQSAPEECAQARDPVRCAARQAALITCAEKRGAEKQACLQESLPPVDCSQADNPEECAAIEQAKEKCADKKGTALTACLNPGATKQKAGKSRKSMKKNLGYKSRKKSGKTTRKIKPPSGIARHRS